MEPRKDESRKEPEPRKEGQKRRFQIVKLEERIAPCSYPYRGRRVHYPGPCWTRGKLCH